MCDFKVEFMLSSHSNALIDSSSVGNDAKTPGDSVSVFDASTL